MKDWEVETLVINGDLVDFYRISRFEKDAERGVKLQFELTASKEVLRDLREAFPEARILLVPGNHDVRMGRFCNLHPEIAGLQALQLENLLEFERFKVELMPDQFVIGGSQFVVEHGDRCSSKSAATAAKMLDRRGLSGISGHVHRAGVHHRTFHDRQLS